jgi:selenocysteine lyase/cysteine desulfurase
MDAIAEYERGLSKALVAAVLAVEGAAVHGVTQGSFADRVPTVCFGVAGVASSAIAEGLAARDIGARSGHMYSPRLMRRLNLLPGGAVRVSLVHYNTPAEVTRFGDVLAEVVAQLRTTRRHDAHAPTAG